MARLIGNMDQGSIGGGFKFSHIRTEQLGASEYTLVTIAVDRTGSVGGFEKELSKCIIASIDSCRKSPRAENLLIRVILFSDYLPNGVQEIHGFKRLQDIDPKEYENIDTGGGTPLYDAAYSAVAATNEYAKILYNDDFSSNGIVIIITDGCDNASVMSPKAVHDEIQKGIKGEFIESNIVLLIGINAAQYKTLLERFQLEAKIDKYIDAGDATPSKLAKLAEFIAQSVSSQSQALGTGGPSQTISATI